MSRPARPDHASDRDNYIPVREMSLRKNNVDSLTKRPPKTDREMGEYEDYLRRKWGCAEEIPDSFDPDKLDAVLKSRLSTTTTRGRPRGSNGPLVSRGDEMFMTPTEPQNTPHEDTFTSLTSDTNGFGCCTSQDPLFASSEGNPLNTKNEIEKHEASIHKNETPITPTKNTTQPRPQPNLAPPRGCDKSMSDTPGQASQPRLRAGSRPPLSRSAFMRGGVPCTDEKCQGACKRGVLVKGHARPPDYFPFKSQARRPSRSRDRQNQHSKSRADTESPRM
ncbi:hypothetical protein F5X97DRAFT_323032 [Nemania serpens]|nr:hypothetical protein F5X97DRAFT_323032 [Nemania serpens]